MPAGPARLPMGQFHSDSEPIRMCATAPAIALSSVGAVVPWTLQESGTVVERIHLDVSAPSARQGSFLGAVGRRGAGVRGGTEATIESPRARSTRRAAPASRQARYVAAPERFWATFYVGNHSSYRSEERQRGHDTRTLHESGTVVEDDTPGCKCAFGAINIVKPINRTPKRTYQIVQLELPLM